MKYSMRIAAPLSRLLPYASLCAIMRHYTEFGLIDATGHVFVSEIIIYISQRYMMRQKYLYSGYSAI